MARSPAFRGVSPASPITSVGTGAIGGPRGVAAGVIRILVEFATAYNPAGLKKLQAELIQNQNRIRQIQGGITQRTNNINKLEEARVRALEFQRSGMLKNVRILDAQGKVTETLETATRAIAQLQVEVNKGLRAGHAIKTADGQLLNVAELQARRNAAVQAIVTRFNRDAVDLAGKKVILDQTGLLNHVRLVEIQRDLNQKKQNLIPVEKGLVDLQGKQLTTQKAIDVQTGLRAAALGRLGGLLTGLVGFTVAGAAFSAAFELIQAGIDLVSKSMQDALDPGAKYREMLKRVGEEVNELAESENLTKLEAALKLLNQSAFSTPGLPALGGGAGVAGALATLGGIRELDTALTKQLELLNSAKQVDVDRQALLNRFVSEYSKFFQSSEDNREKEEAFVREFGTPKQIEDYQALINIGNGRAQQNSILQNILRSHTEEILAQVLGLMDAATEAERLRDALNDIELEGVEQQLNSITSALGSLQENAQQALDIQFGQKAEETAAAMEALAEKDLAGQRQHIDNLKDQLGELEVIESRRTKRLQQSLDNLGDFESARTRQLTAAIEALNDAEERRDFLARLNDINEQKRIILLERRLEHIDHAIDISKFFGQERIVALNAEIERLQEIDQFQSRQIQHLELIRNLNQQVTRQSGESIQDFVGRRALENRKRLAEFESFQRAGQITRLQGRAENVQTNVQLGELNEQRAELFRQRALKQQQERLQELLQQSQEADQAAQDAQRAHLEKLLEASKKADQRDLERRQKDLQAEIDAEQTAFDTREENWEKARDRAVELVQEERDLRKKEVEGIYKDQAEAIKKGNETALELIDKGLVEQRKLAIASSSDKEEIAKLTGTLAGSAEGMAQIQAWAQSMGLNPDSTLFRTIMENARTLRLAAATRLHQLNNTMPSFQQGGVFPLRNSMFGGNMRWGEGGQELGVVLSNRVSETLRKNGRGPLVESINVSSYEDPKRATFRLRQLMKDVVREEIRG